MEIESLHPIGQYSAKRKEVDMKSFAYVAIVIVLLTPYTVSAAAQIPASSPAEARESFSHAISAQMKDPDVLTEKERQDIDEAIEKSESKLPDKSVEKLLTTRRAAVRHEILNRTSVWKNLKATTWELISAFLMFFGWLAVVYFVGHRYRYAQEKKHPNTEENRGKTGEEYYKYKELCKSPLKLIFRDLEPVSYDTSLHRTFAQESEYRGFLHWNRDVLEKLLSLALMLTFCLFLARAGRYICYWVMGEAWKLVYVPLDINIALTFLGFALIIDGFILVSTMTDAPGISRTLDTVIVVLAGSLVMLVEARPGVNTLVTFRFSESPWMVPLMAGTIGLLFLVRWVVRNRSIKELWEHEKPEKPDQESQTKKS